MPSAGVLSADRTAAGDSGATVKATIVDALTGFQVAGAAPNNYLLVGNGTHMGIANSAALKTLGITNGVRRLPHGGSAILDARGEPTGQLHVCHQ